MPRSPQGHKRRGDRLAVRVQITLRSLALLTGRRADLYVVDYLMPTMNGPELVKRIRQQYPDGKVLYVTAVSEQLFEQTRLLRENEAFLQKPFGARDLREAVSLLIFDHIRGLD